MRDTLVGALVACLLVACGGGGGGSTEGSGGGGGSGGAGSGASNGSGSTGGGGSNACQPPLPTFADGKVSKSTLTVQAGAALGGDGSDAKPFGSLDAALAVATPGTTVRVIGSLPAATYKVGLKGTPDAPIWIHGEANASIGPLTLEGASNVIVEDLEISNSPSGHVLHFFFGENLLFRRLRIHDAGLGCIKGSQTTNAFVEDADLWNAGQSSEHPIIDFVGVNGAHIVRSAFHHGPGVMIMLKGGTSDLLFAWNEVYDQTTPGNALALGQSTGPMYFQPKDSAFEGLRLVAFANRLHDLVGAPIAFEGCKDCAAVHNTVWSTTGGQLVRFLPGAAGEASGVTVSKPEGCRFAGNVIVGGQENGASLNADAANIGPGNVVDHNVFLKPGALNWWGEIPQDTAHSTYDQDPQLSAEGVPGNVALVDGKGPPDIGSLPFANAFVQDANGACMKQPTDIGAISVP
ncbi:hypothetical protein [Polyangium aurulentum]|uniref:hypothetical protein n=1 Tax=Polyangium aurulentum TaxID=2567896 RepID=UPI00197F0698|nr:hypothetical protein [Polyangium aurulentum]UQA58504.1 hypothetical protein E8A73_045915 [Polyangium aurulentum]